MTFRVLDAAAPAERQAWVDLWSAWQGREVFAHPAYAARFAGPADRVLAATDGRVLYPFILRPLAALPWAAPDEPGWDLVTPYGYGGPYALAPGDAGPFWDAFDTWARDVGLVTSFARLSVFPGQLADFRGEVVTAAPNVVRSLDLDPDALWRDYEHKVRKNVKRALSHGLTVEVDETGARLADFLGIYERTMDRRQAASGYYFGAPFFEAIVRDLPGQYAFFHVLHEGRVVSTELVLASARHLYSYLGGTDAEAFELRPNDLLKHEVALWGGVRGFTAYVLGGGYGGPDGIFRYKKSFAPSGEVPFRVGRAVHDLARCNALTASRDAWAAAEHLPERRPDFFPPYRA